MRPLLALSFAALLAAPALAADKGLELASLEPSPVLVTSPPSRGDAAQLRTGMKGLSFFLPSAGGAGLSLGLLMSPTSALRIEAALEWTLTDGRPVASSDFAFSLGLGYRMYLLQAGRLLGFLEPGFSLGRAATISTIVAGASVGAEYFLLDRFSIAAATGLGLSIGNLGGAGSASIGIGTHNTALYANFYFP
jgi:hypothetical protein